MPLAFIAEIPWHKLGQVIHYGGRQPFDVGENGKRCSLQPFGGDVAVGKWRCDPERDDHDLFGTIPATTLACDDKKRWRADVVRRRVKRAIWVTVRVAFRLR